MNKLIKRFYQFKTRLRKLVYRDLAPGDSRPAPVTHWSCLYRRELLMQHQIRYIPCRINEDVPFVHLAFALAQSAKTVDRLMLSYWSNPKSSLRPVRDTLEEALKSLKLEEDAFQKRGLSIDNRQTALSVFYTPASAVLPDLLQGTQTLSCRAGIRYASAGRVQALVVSAET